MDKTTTKRTEGRWIIETTEAEVDRYRVIHVSIGYGIWGYVRNISTWTGHWLVDGVSERTVRWSAETWTTDTIRGLDALVESVQREAVAEVAEMVA